MRLGILETTRSQWQIFCVIALASVAAACIVWLASLSLAERIEVSGFEDPLDSVRGRLGLAQPLWSIAPGIGRAELLLIGISFAVTVWSSAIGASGAVTFAAMASILPPAAVIPIHAVTIAAANLFRTWSLLTFVDWRFVLPFVIGAVAGFVAGIPLLDRELFSPDGMRILLGVFILIAAWVPLKRLTARHGSNIGIGGAVTSFLTLFIGATTPLVAGLVGQAYQDHRRVLGTLAACMLFQHGSKIVIFGLNGFSFSQYLSLLILLLAASAAGVYVGRRLLLSVPQSVVKPIFKAALTVIGLDLLRRGLLA